MRAARIHQYGAGLVVEDVPTPQPGPGQVLVRVEGAGFCHSDIHVIDGDIRILPRMPLIIGHENAGTVAALGSGVTSVREGDRVAVFGAWGCGRCDYCVTGFEQLCETPQWAGLSIHDGGYAEYLLVPHERYLVKLGKLEPKVAAPMTDAALTPYRAIKRALTEASSRAPAARCRLRGRLPPVCRGPPPCLPSLRTPARGRTSAGHRANARPSAAPEVWTARRNRDRSPSDPA